MRRTVCGFLLGWFVVSAVLVQTTALADPGTGGNPALALNASQDSLFVKPGETVHVNLDVSNLPTKVNACQAFLGFSSSYLTATAGCVQPGGGVWDQLIYNSWDVGAGVAGEIDTAIGLDVHGAVGTDEDGTVAKITLTAGANEGSTQVVFRPDGDDNHSTYFSDMLAQALYPTVKADSQAIVIDGTNPVVGLTAPNGGEQLLGGKVYEITWTASDLNLGSNPIDIDYSPDGGASWYPVASGEANDGTYDWTVPGTVDTDDALVRVTATDQAGNSASDQSDAPFSISAMNRLALDVQEPCLFVQPGAPVLIDMNVTNLGQKVNACQAMLGFSSYYLSAAGGCVQPGGGVWDQLIYNSWDVGAGTPGEIDTAIGLDAQGAVGTDEDGTVAKITLTAGANEGATQIIFRPDGDDTHSTFFSDLLAQPVWPYKVDSLLVVIDGTPPSVQVIQPSGGEILTGSQTYDITWTATDLHPRPDTIKIEYSTDGGGTWNLVAESEPNDGTFTWTVPNVDTTIALVRVKFQDKAGNWGQDVSDSFFAIDSSKPALSIATAKQAVTEGPFNAYGFAYQKVVNGGTKPLSGVAFSPSGDQIVYIDRTGSLTATYQIKLLDRPTDTTIILAQSTRNGTGSTGFLSYLTPYFSADGTRIGWNKTYYDSCNELEVCDLRSLAITTYRPVNNLPPPDAANSDFYGSFTDQWVAWDWNPSTYESDLKIYGAFFSSPYWYWQVKSSLTTTTAYAEYEPDSDRAGTRILYYSGMTSSEPIYTVHLLRWSGSAWVRDAGFSPITGASWPYWSADETEVGLIKYDNPPGSGRGDLYVYDSNGAFKFDLTGNAIPQYLYSQTFGFNFATGPSGAGREYLFLSNAGNTQGGRDIWVARQTPELLYSARTGPVAATQGYVYIDLAASDSVSGLAGPPTVTVTDSLGTDIPAALHAVSGGTFRYRIEITPSVANGKATVRAECYDTVGHQSTDIDYFDINRNRASGSVWFGTLSGATYWVDREVTFKATDPAGAVLKTWKQILRFENQPGSLAARGYYALDGIPAGTARLSAKTGFSLRSRRPLGMDSEGQGLVDFWLAGGDLDGSNTVGTLDYSVLKNRWMTTSALEDINGDGQVQLLDYSLMKSSWYTSGDPE